MQATVAAYSEIMLGQPVVQAGPVAQVPLGTNPQTLRCSYATAPVWAVSQFCESVEGGCSEIEAAHTSLSITFSEAIHPRLHE